MESTKPPPAPVLLRAPLAPAALLLMAGIASALAWAVPPAVWAAGAIAGALGALVVCRRAHLHALACAMLGVAVFAAGAWWTDLSYRGARPDDVLLYSATARSLTSLRGRIVSIPQILDQGPQESAGYREGPRTHAMLAVEAVLTREGWRDASGLTGLSIDGADDRLRAGQEVEAMGWLTRQRGPDNPGQYDRLAAARLRGSTTRLGVNDTEAVTILHDPHGPSRLWWALRSSGRSAAESGDEGADQTLLAALVLGDRADSLASLNRLMARSGLAHYLSISGSHLAVLLGMVYLLCRLAGLTPRVAAGAVLAVLIAYLLVTQWRSPLLRSAIQAAAVCVGVMLGRRTSVLNSLALAAIILLAIDPLELTDVGFQLSFAIVAAMVLAHRAVKSLLFGRWLRRRGLMVFRNDQRLRRWLSFRAGDWAMDAAAMALTAYAASAPLVAWHFGFFSPYAAVLTLAAFPIVTAVLVPGYVALLLGPVMPNLAWHVQQSAEAMAGVAHRWAMLVAKLPMLAIDLRPVGPAWVVLTYAAAVIVLMRARFRRPRLTIAAVCIVWLAATAWTQRTAPAPEVAELEVLAVGAGQCAVLHCPGGQAVLLDVGTRSGFDVYQQVLGPMLRERRLPRPAMAFVSHANTDHYNGLFSYLDERRLGTVYTTTAFEQGLGLDGDAGASANLLLRRLWGSGTEVRTLSAGQRVVLDERTSIEVLWPRADVQTLTANDSSLVLRVCCDDKRVLLCGDIEEPAQRALLAEPEQLRCDVLVLPHHAGWSATLPELVAASGAKVLLASAGQDPCGIPRGDPDARSFYAKLARQGQFRCTARNGCLSVRFGRAVLQTAGAR